MLAGVNRGQSSEAKSIRSAGANTGAARQAQGNNAALAAPSRYAPGCPVLPSWLARMLLHGLLVSWCFLAALFALWWHCHSGAACLKRSSLTHNALNAGRWWHQPKSDANNPQSSASSVGFSPRAYCKPGLPHCKTFRCSACMCSLTLISLSCAGQRGTAALAGNAHRQLRQLLPQSRPSIAIARTAGMCRSESASASALHCCNTSGLKANVWTS